MNTDTCKIQTIVNFCRAHHLTADRVRGMDGCFRGYFLSYKLVFSRILLGYYICQYSCLLHKIFKRFKHGPLPLLQSQIVSLSN